MPSPYHGLQPPYTLPSNVVYFHDWRYVSPGSFAWQADDGSAVPMWGLDPYPPMHLDYHDIPLGIAIEAQKATKSEPVIAAESAGQVFLFGGTLIEEDGRYRLWVESWPKEHVGTPHMGIRNNLHYGESDDGVEWRFPNLGLVEWNGSRDNSIVYGGDILPAHGFHGGCVFKDPSAPPEERYKAWHLGLVSQEMLDRYREARPDAIDPFNASNPSGLFGAVSPDGLRWTPLPGPMVVQTSDTHNVCTYDEVRRKYVAYCRSWFFDRRSIGRMETDDFRCFPLPEELFWPNAMAKPYDTWYANGKTMMPGTVDYHLMFPMRWSLPEDSFEFHLATSPDGVVWGFVPGGPVAQPGDMHSWDRGVVSPGIGMVNLPGNRMGILMTGCDVPHKHPRRPGLGRLGWAWWTRGRLTALVAEGEGSFCTFPLRFSGRTAVLNFATSYAGYVRVEAVGPDGKVIEGHAFEDCDRIHGDSTDHTVTWRGQSDLGHPEGAAVSLRFRLRSARLFGICLG